jgi:hypothetical protein
MAENDKHLIDNNDVKDQIKRLRQLNEYVDRNKVFEAIKNKDVVYIYYAGDETVNRGYRTIEPFVIGRTRAGNVVVRAWQQAGATDTGNAPTRKNDVIPGWRLFRLDGIASMVRTLKKFETDQAYLQTNRPNYNPADKQMVEIFFAIQPGTGEPAQDQKGQQSVTQPNTQTTTKQPDNFFQAQAQKFKNFFKQPVKASTAWIEDQKRKFIDIMKKPKQ